MDIMSKLPSLVDLDLTGPDAERSADEEKVQRIDFHRAHVRNGPAKFSTPTNGQVRRIQARLMKGMQKKTRRKQIADHFATRRLAAFTRGHLQTAGVLPFALETTRIDPEQQILSTIWLVQRFSDGQVSFAHDDVLVTLGSALEFYGKATGQASLQVPAGYEVAVYEAAA